MFFEFFAWWYGKGWLKSWRMGTNFVTAVRREFSVPVLLRTLFSPWKRIVSGRGRGPGELFRSMIDNLLSRFVGFVVRAAVLLASVVMMLLAGAAGLALTVSWPLIPVAIVYLSFRSVTG